MDVYRLALCDALKRREDSDGFEVISWPQGEPVLDGERSRIRKAFANYMSYPLRVRSETQRASIVHFLDHSSANLIKKIQPGALTVVTLHDLIPLRYPGELNCGQIQRFRKKANQLKEADAIIAVSEYSKNEAIELVGCDPESIHVVPNGVRVLSGKGLKSEVVTRMRERGNRIIVFSIGSTLPRKNLQLLPKALGVAQKILGTKVGLVRAGAKLNGELRKEIESVVGEGGFHEFGRIEQDELDSLYHEIDLVFIPSLYEGFGLPVLEAFAAGKAVVCSDRTSLPEVGKQEAHYFDPDDAESAGRAIAAGSLGKASLSCEERRKAIAGAHSWDRHLDSLFRIYGALLNRG